MVLPAPNLDDRTFQNLVDDAKRYVQQHCPEWSDHNVSDPGVTLIEAFAQMVDQLIYRLNRVPERHYLKFLELIGVELRPPSAARGEITFWLSNGRQTPDLTVAAQTEVATDRTDLRDPVVFSTVSALEIKPCTAVYVGAEPAGGAATVRVPVRPMGNEPLEDPGVLAFGEGFPCFSEVPAPEDALLIGLSVAVPACAVRLSLECPVAGSGIDPLRPPLRWEAWTRRGWEACELEHDWTGGLNRNGEVLLHVPRGHLSTTIAGKQAGWLRCTVVRAEEGQPRYIASPRIRRVSASTAGGTVGIVHAEVVKDDRIGISDGTPGQRFALRRHPVVPSEVPFELEVNDGSGWQPWRQVEHFANSDKRDRDFRVDLFAGEVQFGPAVRLADGGFRAYGAIPPKGAALRAPLYRSGGGLSGNVEKGRVRVLKSSVPYMKGVENRISATGGADAETIEDAKIRGPLMLRSRGRAVTAEDFEELAREVAAETRVRCIEAEGQVGEARVRLLVVQRAEGDDLGQVPLSDLKPSTATLARIRDHINARRLVGTRVKVQPPQYQWLSVEVGVAAQVRGPDASAALQRAVLRALYRLFHPLNGGPDGTGWPFGRPVQSHEVYAALAQLSGIDTAQEVSVSLVPVDPSTLRRLPAVQRMELPADALVYSYEHKVVVR